MPSGWGHAVASDTSPRVVILYGHPLLGEGLARCVRAET
jgi:hypothetical protein